MWHKILDAALESESVWFMGFFGIKGIYYIRRVRQQRKGCNILRIFFVANTYFWFDGISWVCLQKFIVLLLCITPWLLCQEPGNHSIKAQKYRDRFGLVCCCCIRGPTQLYYCWGLMSVLKKQNLYIICALRWSLLSN